MISRRPNTRASTENAPGPRPMIAKRIAAPKITVSSELHTLDFGTGMSEIASPPPASATSPPAIGVKKPTTSNVPVEKANRPANHVAGEELFSTR